MRGHQQIEHEGRPRIADQMKLHGRQIQLLEFGRQGLERRKSLGRQEFSGGVGLVGDVLLEVEKRLLSHLLQGFAARRQGGDHLLGQSALLDVDPEVFHERSQRCHQFRRGGRLDVVGIERQKRSAPGERSTRRGTVKIASTSCGDGRHA